MRQQLIWGILLFFGFIIYSPNLTAQNAVLTVINAETSEACSFANVVLYDLNNNYLKGERY